MDINVTLHARQEEIYVDSHRFKVVAAGRRFGKSYLASIILLVEGAKQTKIRPSDGVEVDLALEEVWCVGPTFEQEKRIMWPVLLEIGHGLIAHKHEQTGVLTLVNGRKIAIKGSDRPDNLRGSGLSAVVMDEYAFMRPEVFDIIIYPQLARTEGSAMFIGTPDGKNHFHEMWLRGQSNDPKWEEWKSWHFPSIDNPYLPKAEIAKAESSMSRDHFRQEFLADFESGAGYVLRPSDFPIVEYIPGGGDKYIAVDLAGFEKAEGGRTLVQRDSHAIAVVHNHAGGWCVERIIHGQWDVRETALRIVKAFKDYRPLKLGIEKGIAQRAVMPYLEDMMTQFGVYFNVEELTHGNQHKPSRIAWALQGRSEKGRIQLLKGKNATEWIPDFLTQCNDFPNQLAHDDLIDALAYIDQIADPYYDGPLMETYWTPQDEVSYY